MRLLLSGLLAVALACAGTPETSKPGAVHPEGSEPVASGPIVIVEPPPEPKPIGSEAEPPPTVQPSDEMKMQAKQLFQDGAQLFEAGDFAAAASKFEQAYALAPMPALLFNIGRAREQLGDVGGACATYRRLDTDPQADVSMRDRARQQLAQLSCP